MRLLRFVVIFLLGAVVIACGSKNPAGPTLANGSMSAKVGGASWVADAAISAVRVAGGLTSIGGTDKNGRSIAFALIVNTQDTFTILNNSATGLNFLLTEPVSGGTSPVFSALFGGASTNGTVTFQTLSATGASGTFSFVGAANPGTGASGTKSVTDGKFNVTF